FFVLTALQPVVRQRLLENSRQRLLAQIERRRGSRVILLVHRQETMSLLGFPIFRYIDVNDAEDMMRACEMTDSDVPLDLVLQTRTQTPEKARELAQLLATGTWTHDYAITFEEAQRIGLKVSSDMPPDVFRMMSLYPQPTRRHHAVEYLPTPRRTEQRRPTDG